MIELRKHATECRPFSVSGKATPASRARSRVAAGLGVVEESRHVSTQCAREPGDLQSVCVSRPVREGERPLDLDGELGHSIYSLTQSLHVGNRGRVGGGILVGAGDVTLEGEVNRGVTMYAGHADVSGTIARELTMAGDSLTLTNAARVGGNLSAHVRQLKNVHIPDGATIGGKRDIQVRVRKSRFTCRGPLG